MGPQIGRTVEHSLKIKSTQWPISFSSETSSHVQFRLAELPCSKSCRRSEMSRSSSIAASVASVMRSAPACCGVAGRPEAEIPLPPPAVAASIGESPCLARRCQHGPTQPAPINSLSVVCPPLRGAQAEHAAGGGCGGAARAGTDRHERPRARVARPAVLGAGDSHRGGDSRTHAIACPTRPRDGVRQAGQSSASWVTAGAMASIQVAGEPVLGAIRAVSTPSAA